MINITADLLNTIERFVCNHAPDIDWKKQATGESWLGIEILGHLTDSALVNLQRFVRCTYESDFVLTYAQDEWVAAQRCEEADVTELLTLWQLINKQIIVVLDNYPADRWDARCNDHTVEFLAIDYIDHMRHHLDQIIELKYTD
ncbi:DinB family protein [Mucilaginibacter calamicampi]|uniref:DinB family protein n=1 Tax=Mucilaginibacter calamicampi TaxID=1302352 RepID=A0ABW2YWT4_9SPHI